LKLRFYGYVPHGENGKVCFVLVQAADLSDSLYFVVFYIQQARPIVLGIKLPQHLQFDR
jgi:hypothetical protein